MARTRHFTTAFGCVALVSLVLGYSSSNAQITGSLRTCGNEGELACGLLEKDAYNAPCDSGLAAQVERCGCLLQGPFGGCLIPRFCAVCRNDTRHRPGTAAVFRSSWADWALRNQREQLAIDEPLNWVMHLGTHNAFNSFSDGHEPRILSLIPGVPGVVSEIADAPNQFYSITGQLDLGSRMLALDAHWAGVPGGARLCHSFVWDAVPALEPAICLNPSGQIGSNLFPSMRYFANGIKEIRNWLDRNPDAILAINLENYVGCGDGCQGQASYIFDPLVNYLDAPTRRWILRHPAGQPLPSRAEMLAMGKRVVIIFNGTPRVEGLNWGLPEGDVVSGSYQTWLRNNQDFQSCVGTVVADDEVVRGGPAVATRGEFSVVVEDRTLQRWFVELTESGAFGELSVDDMRRVASCNYSIVATDFLGSQLPLGRSLDLPNFARHEALVWSWKPGDRGQNGDCAMLEAASGRWVSTACSQTKHYACAPPRSESGTDDRSAWNPREDRWWISNASGPWDGGAAACASELPPAADGSTPYVFSVPVNGFQNDKLKTANVRGVDVWLNYTDQVREGSWVIPRIGPGNARPVADAGEDQTVECGGDVRLDGTASTDANGDPLTYTWSGLFGTLTGPVVTAHLPAGVHVITLTVNDGRGGVDTDSTTITVSDTVPPSLEVSLSPSVLAPANHRMVTVKATVLANDHCDGDDVDIRLVSIVSNEPADDKGDGRTQPDIEGAELGTGDLEFLLRAERSGQGLGRVYTVKYRATDSAGNSTEATAKVVVRHDSRK